MKLASCFGEQCTKTMQALPIVPGPIFFDMFFVGLVCLVDLDVHEQRVRLLLMSNKKKL